MKGGRGGATAERVRPFLRKQCKLKKRRIKEFEGGGRAVEAEGGRGAGQVKGVGVGVGLNS